MPQDTGGKLNLKIPVGSDDIRLQTIGIDFPYNFQTIDDAFTAHMAETVIKQNLTINVPTDYPTVQAALDALKYAWIPRDVTVTIQVAAGTYTHTSPIVVDHPCGSQIRIVGATPITTTITGAGTVSGSAGNWSVPITVADVTGIQVGQYAIIRNTSGTGDHFAYRGIWEIIAVDAATKTVTVKNTHTASTFPTATLSGGDFVVLTTILKFTDCSGIWLYDKSLGYLDNVAIVGNNSASTTIGIEVGYFDWLNVRGGTINCGNYVGVNGFTVGFAAGNGGSILGNALVASVNGVSGFYAAYSGSIDASYSTASGNGFCGFYAAYSGSINAPSSTASGNGGSGFYARGSSSINAASSTASGNGSNGFYAQYSGSIDADSSTASGNSAYGFSAQYSGSINADSSTASGNSGNGFYAQHSGSIDASYSTASGNGFCGFYAAYSGSINAPSSTASGNGDHGFYATYFGSINAPSSTASGNGTDYRAQRMGYIYCANYVGTPTFSPSLNTEGNYNAIITT